MEIVVEALQPCGCRFVYEPDHSKPYYAKWALCGKPECIRVQGRINKEQLETEIKMAKDRLAALQWEYSRRYPA